MALLGSGRSSFRLSHFLYAILVIATMAPSGIAQSDVEAKKPAASAAETKRRAERLDEMTQLAAKLSLEESDAKSTIRHLVIDRPLIHFTDADRGIFDGTLWGYGREGRPVAVVEMYCGTEIPAIYRHATTATCDRPLKLVGAPNIQWTPQSSAVKWAALKADDAPANDPAARLRQIKALSKRFGVYQIFEPRAQREELRLLVQPLHRYSEKSKDIRDGVLFAFALGTNPEALLFIEAHDGADGVATWHYGLARRGSAASLHGLLDGDEVWNVPRLVSVEPEDPHVHFFRSLTGDPRLTVP